MQPSLRVGRILGIPVSVNGGLAVLASLFLVTLTTQGLPRLEPEAGLGVRLAVAAATVVVFLASVLAHELGHAVVARRRGVGVLGITLSLLGGYAQLDRQAPDPRSGFSIAAAGPAVNIVIGIALGAGAWTADRLGFDDRLVIGAVVWLAVVNLVLAVLNLFPAAPLDGGRVLTAALWKRLGDAERARVVSGRAGLILGALLVPLGLLQAGWWGWRGLVTLVVGVFLFNGARSEIMSATIRGRLAGTRAGDLMAADPPSVPDSLTLEQLRSFAGDDRRSVAFPVTRWSPEPIGYVHASAGSGLDGPSRSWTSIGALMQPTPQVARVWVNEPLDEILRRHRGPDDLLVVVHEPQAGRVVGTLTAGQLEPLLRIPDLWGRDRPSGGRVR